MREKYFPQFYKDWIQLVKKNKNTILKKKIIGCIVRNNKIRSILVDTKIKTKNKQVFERSILIDKPGVIIIPIFYFKKTIFTVLVKQFRICKGENTYEFPSGNAENKNLSFEAIKELTEETNINLKKKDLKKLDSIQMITSTNSSIAHYFYFEKKVNKKFLQLLENRKTGNQSENEFITLKVFKVKDLYKLNIANIFAGLTMLRKRKIIQF
tara:strand:- start:3753 stop:4385 length:633 start_codon:yes stop_codon:yes gene_type:complete